MTVYESTSEPVYVSPSFTRSATSVPKQVVADPSSFASPDISRALEQEDKIDSYIADALNSLSIQERDAVFYEMHGVNEGVEETPQYLAQKLLEMEHSLKFKCQSLSNDSPIRIALSISPEFVWDPLFLLMFLRSESFRIERSTNRLVKFFELKLYLFGRDKLARHITLEDLDKNDRESLDSGFLQLLPIRDRAGRAILILMLQHQTYKVPENMTRALYYLVFSALDDEATQRKGMTVILYNVGHFDPRKTDLRTVSQGGWVQASVPIKTCSLHHCFSDTRFRAIFNFALRFFSDDARARCKFHFGTGLECVYVLMTYGVPPHALPINMVDGVEMKRKNHNDFLRMRKRQEAISRWGEGPPRIVVPSNIDVLFGRGKKFREHMGNIKMADVLEKHLERYESAGLKQKSVVIAEVTQEIKSQGARFLKMENNLWLEVHDKLAKEKVSHGFRTRIRINGGSAPMGSSPNKAPSRTELDIENLNEKKRARVVDD